MTTMGVFTSQKWANAANQGFVPKGGALPAHHCHDGTFTNKRILCHGVECWGSNWESSNLAS